MEASAAAQGGQGGDGGQQGAAQQGDQAQGGQDYGALASQLETLSQGQEELRNFLQSNPWQQQAEGEGEGETGEPELDLSFLDDQSQYLEPAQLQQQLGDVINNAVQQQVQAQVGPIQQAQAEARMEQQARDLVSEFPELGERETAEQVVGLAGEIADQNFPPEVAKALKNSPTWWRQVFLSGRGVEAANAEGSETPQAAHLEGGGGARPAGSQQVDLGDQITEAARGGRSALPF